MASGPRIALALVFLATGCGQTPPTTPDAPPTPTVEAPVPSAPAAGMLLGDFDRPVTLIALNPSAPAATGPVTYSFVVATDSAFANIVASRAVPRATTIQTSVTLDELAPGAVYYWRVWATSSGATGALSATAAFSIGPAIASGTYRMTIDTPATSCGGLFSEPLVIDGDLDRQSGQVVFGRKFGQPTHGFANFDYMALRLSAVGRDLSGTLSIERVRATSPSYVDVDRVYDSSFRRTVDATATANPDGSLSGAFSGGMRLFRINQPYSDQSCESTFKYSITKR